MKCQILSRIPKPHPNTIVKNKGLQKRTFLLSLLLQPETTDYHYEASVVDIVRRLFLMESKARFTEVICQWLTLIPAVEIVESKDMPFKMRCTLNFNTIALIEEIKKTEAGKER